MTDDYEYLCARTLAAYGVSWADVTGPDRRPTTRAARDAVCWMLHQRQEKPFSHEYSYSHIGRIIGGRSETTVRDSILRHEGRIDLLDRAASARQAYLSSLEVHP
jgi:hypothetical protein